MLIVRIIPKQCLNLIKIFEQNVSDQAPMTRQMPYEPLPVSVLLNEFARLKRFAGGWVLV